MASNELEESTDALQTLWENDAQLDRLAHQAVQEALQAHKRNGQSVVIWRDGQIVTLLPSEIPGDPAGENAL